MPRVSRVSSSLRSLVARRRWSEEVARRVIQAGERSALSWPQFAAELGVDLARLYRWRRRLGVSGAAAPATAATTSFLPLIPSGGAEAPDAEIEIVTEGGRRVRIGAAVPAELATAVLRAVMC
jgi:transposase-like protein